MTYLKKPCKDCEAEGRIKEVPPKLWRAAKYPGPRCATHWRLVKKQRSRRAHGLRIKSDFQITEEQYWELYRSQGGVCAICRVATGESKRLAVDHDHDLCDSHDPELGCPRCIRGLLCSRCNYILLGILDREALLRAMEYLESPPARSILVN